VSVAGSETSADALTETGVAVGRSRVMP